MWGRSVGNAADLWWARLPASSHNYPFFPQSSVPAGLVTWFHSRALLCIYRLRVETSPPAGRRYTQDTQGNIRHKSGKAEAYKVHKPPLPKVIKAGNKCWGWGCAEGGGVYADSQPGWTARKRHSEPVELPVCPSESWRDMTFRNHHLCWDELSSDDFESFPTPVHNPKKITRSSQTLKR